MRAKLHEVRSVPRFLQKAVRWSVMGVAGAALAGQLMGVSLITPARAGGPPPPTDPNCIRCFAQASQCVDARDCTDLPDPSDARTACFDYCGAKLNFCLARHGCVL